jgi:hypothetical protein
VKYLGMWARTVAHHGEKKESTHVWQMIDRGVGNHLKQLFAEQQDAWLEQDVENFKRFSEGGLKAWERRVLCTQWVGAAHRKYISQHAATHTKYCNHSGLNVTLDGTDDQLIKIDAVPAFKTPAPEPLHAFEMNACYEEVRRCIIPQIVDADDDVEQLGSDSEDCEDPSSTSTDSSSSSDDSADDPDELASGVGGPAPPASASDVVHDGGADVVHDGGHDDLGDSDVAAASVGQVVDMLRRAEKRGRLETAARMFITKIGSPFPAGSKYLANLTITSAVLVEAFGVFANLSHLRAEL